MAAVMRFRPDARKLWFSKVRSRISPSLWKNTARRSALLASPLFSPAWLRWEAASGGRWDRPELHRLLDHLREGDTVVVWKLDRLSRSLKDVLHIMERIGNVGAGFRSITEHIDTTTPAGRMRCHGNWVGSRRLVG